jgi:threonine dehydratase
MHQNPTTPDFAEVLSASHRIAPHIKKTPILESAELNQLSGCNLFFKCENLQYGGAFKLRGACNAVFSLDQAKTQPDVVTHSSGNHGIALSIAAKKRGYQAHVVMPNNAPRIKREHIRALGARIIECEPNLQSRTTICDRVLAETKGHFVHPYDNPYVIAGQGTAALEMLKELGSLDVIITPVSGGGLLAGTHVAAQGIDTQIAVIGAEPDQAADAYLSLQQNRRITDMQPNTICDGLRASLGHISFSVLSTAKAEILLVSEQEIIAAMRLIWDHLKLVVETSSSVTLAALLKNRSTFQGRRVGIILSGGNVDLDRLPW